MDAQDFPPPPKLDASANLWKKRKTEQKLREYWHRYASEGARYDESETLMLLLNREQRYEEALQMIEKDPSDAQARAKGALSYARLF
jgi:hypothetical protein